MNGTSALMKETPEAAGPAIMGGYSRKIAVYESGNWLSPGIESVGILISDILAFRTRNFCCLLSHSVHGTTEAPMY
jgi:hypothetical protein